MKITESNCGQGSRQKIGQNNEAFSLINLKLMINEICLFVRIIPIDWLNHAEHKPDHSKEKADEYQNEEALKNFKNLMGVN